MNNTVSSMDILGVRVDKVGMDQALSQVEEMLGDGKKHFIVTPNVEFIMAAQKNGEFKRILNQADLTIPDSARFGWAERMLKEKTWLKRALLIPFVIVPNIFPVLPGVDLMDKICQKSVDWGATVGLLGGRKRVAEKSAECLLKKYPGLKISFAEEGGGVDVGGNMINWKLDNSLTSVSHVDILFVAFGQVKQEKWIAKNLDKLPVKVALGVGGSFDYLSGIVPRAPIWMRSLGLEWLFRLIIQPWRIKRQLELFKFVWKVVFS